MASGGSEAKKCIYEKPPTLRIPRPFVVSMIALLCLFGFPRGCSTTNRALYPFLHFFYCIFLRAFLLATFCCFLCFLCVKTLKAFCTGVFASGLCCWWFISRQQPSFFRFLFGTYRFCYCPSFGCVCCFFELGFWFALG